MGSQGEYEAMSVPSSTTNDYPAELDWNPLEIDEPFRDYDSFREGWL